METFKDEGKPESTQNGWRPVDGEQNVSQDPNEDLSEGPVVEGTIDE